MKLIEHLVKTIRETSKTYNPDIQVAPVCILWTDKERQWEEIQKTLQEELPELFILGKYDSENRTGPAIWLRCIIAEKAEDISIPEKKTPIIYLPGISRQDLRSGETCPAFLEPIIELQYRGVIWSQPNTRDWTLTAFLKSEYISLKLEVALDNDTKSALSRSLEALLDIEIDQLRGKKIDKTFLNTLLAGDYIRHLLKWLDQGDTYKSAQPLNEWQAFVETCETTLAFNPDKDGILEGVIKLAIHESAWVNVWERYREAPKRYPNIPNRIRSCKAPPDITWWSPRQKNREGWPQWNDKQEETLRSELLDLNKLTPGRAREKILELEKDHGHRRKSVWSEMGEAPLAKALEYLYILSQSTARTLNTGTLEDITSRYVNTGWQADHALLQALSYIDEKDLDALTTAIQAVYKPWAEDSARYLQKLVEEGSYPGGTISTYKAPEYFKNECILFIDGLRYDLAKKLVQILGEKGCQVEETVRWAALPTVTATGKPAVTPVYNKIIGQSNSTTFEPSVSETGQLVKKYQLDKLLEQAGWSVLDSSNELIQNGNAWLEYSDIDSIGHDKGWKLTKQLDDILENSCNKIIFLNTRWKKIRVVTDHGWLLMPGGLPKSELSPVQIETKWGRCAGLKPGALSYERLFPWYWNPNQSFALADGISCFRSGVEYTHGGLSFQECLTLEILVSSAPLSSRLAPEIIEAVWKGLRCIITVDGVFDSYLLDIRAEAGNSDSSIAVVKKEIKNNGTVSLIIEDEDLEGTPATIVLTRMSGELVAQQNTVIGG